MEESSKSTFLRPMTVAEMMPALGGILSENEKQRMRARQAAVKSAGVSKTMGKDFRPFVTRTKAQLEAEISGLMPRPSPSRNRAPPSTMKKMWNTSTKCDKKRLSHAAGSRHLPARKNLNFHAPTNAASKTVASNIPRPSIRLTFATPKIPMKRANMTMNHLKDNNPNISGICHIQDTPATTKPKASENVEDNKENFPKKQLKRQTALNKSYRYLIGDDKKTAILGLQSNVKRNPTLFAEHKRTPPILTELRARVASERENREAQLQKISIDTDESFVHLQCEKRASTTDPIPSDTSPNSNSETSFLAQEKEIYKETARNIVALPEVSPLVSTPFKKYRNVVEYYNESSEFENTITAANITNLDGDSMLPVEVKEEGDIVTLCDLMDKARVDAQLHDKSTDKYKVELLKMKNELESERKFILMSLKRNEFMLNSVNKLLNLNQGRRTNRTKSGQKTNHIFQRTRLQSCGPKLVTDLGDLNTCPNFIRRNSKSPSYKIPKRSPCLRKLTFFKSMPVDLNLEPVTPLPAPENPAMNVYMKMKIDNKFLITPVHNKALPSANISNTPAITSRNLRSQLEKLYNETP